MKKINEKEIGKNMKKINEKEIGKNMKKIWKKYEKNKRNNHIIPYL